jgi:hypothetical protein
MTVELSPITDADVPMVADFLHEHLNQRVPASAWVGALQVPWKVAAPNHGFLLREAGAVVGAYLAFYSERPVDGRPERFCNLGAWCVLPSHRFQSLRLLKALLAQDGYHFTDLSPSGNVVPLNVRMGFAFLDTATALVPNLPWPTLSSRTRVSSDPRVLERDLAGPELKLYRDHADAAAARHLLISRGARTCYVVFRRDRRKGLPLFASILHVGDPEVFIRSWRDVSRHLLLRHGVLCTLAELRVVGRVPRWAVPLSSGRPKMFRSRRLEAAQIDNLYSELTCVPW